MATRAAGVAHAWDERDTMLYALGVGFGRDPLDEAELAFVLETGRLRTVPTMAAVLTPGAFLADCGWDYTRVLHGEQRLVLHRPLPSAGEVAVGFRVREAWDKGKDKGAVIVTETEGRLAPGGGALFTLGSTLLARGDGGFGGPRGSGPKPHAVPQREPDMRSEQRTRADQALLYRLSGDRNPLHADPALARRVGFERPILHGLCTYGIACRAILATVCGYDYTLVTGFDARFSAPVYPGETVVTDLWQDGNVVSFRCRAAERDALVIDNGRCVLAV